MADEAVHIGPAAASESYLVMDKIIEACKARAKDDDERYRGTGDDPLEYAALFNSEVYWRLRTDRVAKCLASSVYWPTAATNPMRNREGVP